MNRYMSFHESDGEEKKIYFHLPVGLKITIKLFNDRWNVDESGADAHILFP